MKLTKQQRMDIITIIFATSIFWFYFVLLHPLLIIIGLLGVFIFPSAVGILIWRVTNKYVTRFLISLSEHWYSHPEEKLVIVSEAHLKTRKRLTLELFLVFLTVVQFVINIQLVFLRTTDFITLVGFTTAYIFLGFGILLVPILGLWLIEDSGIRVKNKYRQTQSSIVLGGLSLTSLILLMFNFGLLYLSIEYNLMNVIPVVLGLIMASAIFVLPSSIFAAIAYAVYRSHQITTLQKRLGPKC